MSTRPCGSGVRAVFFGYQRAGTGRGPGSPGSSAAGWAERASAQDWAPQSFPLGEATTVLPQGPWWPGTAGVVRCYCPCMRDRVVSMEIASLMRRPRVRVTDVIGSEPIAWNSLSVKLPAGA